MRRHLKVGFTITDAKAHAAKHNYRLEATVAGKPLPGNTTAVLQGKGEPRRGHMNKTEQAFERVLIAMKDRGEIVDYKFEGITLRWGEDDDGRAMRYTPDFVVFNNRKGAIWMCLVEVKGPHIRYKDKVRFRGCRGEWRRFFGFQLWQRSRTGEWKQLA